MKHATTVDRPRRRKKAPALWTARRLFAAGQVLSEGPRVLRPGRLVLGRAPEDGWELADDALLSREHLALEVRGRKLVAHDLDSRNGTERNGRPIQECELSSGDVLRLGDTFVLVREVPADLRPTRARGPLQGLVGEAPAVHRLRRELTLVAPRRTMVLLLGESGTGKNVAAKALHELSGRRGPMVVVNCAAIPAQLAESTLFGHVKGAFTGADRPHDGFFRQADGGTLFLDEVADLPLELQPKLLHAVESGEVTPVGSSRPVAVDVRIVSATSLDLSQAIAGGRFRGELHARLAEFVLALPPLRDRIEDLLPLFSRDLGAPLHSDLAAALLAYGWPFNVRELEKLAAEVEVRGDGLDELGLELIDGRLQAPAAPEPAAGPPDRASVVAALKACGGQVKATAEHLGRSRRQLYRDLERLGLEPDDYR